MYGGGQGRAGCGLRAAGCGLRAAGCGLRAAGCGTRARAGARLRPEVGGCSRTDREVRREPGGESHHRERAGLRRATNTPNRPLDRRDRVREERAAAQRLKKRPEFRCPRWSVRGAEPRTASRPSAHGTEAPGAHKHRPHRFR
ncbi:hypothetical protein CP973_21920 [Streptomyces albofaciens JCM 4342]|nr:hypothetical protein CP973_21920 [Streptomyces albofaciens JCM 4342]